MHWSEEEWKRRSASSDNYAIVASKALYGKSFVVTAGEKTKPGKNTDNTASTLSQAASEEEQRFMLAIMSGSFSQTAAYGLGLRYSDKNTRKNAKYIYRVFAASTSPLFRTDTALFIIETKKEFAIAPVQKLAVYEGDKLISLRWRDAEHYAGYYIERSDNGKAITLNTMTKNIYYKIVAVDDAGLHSDKSFPLNVKVYDSGIRPAIQNFTVIKSSDGKSLQLSWEYPEKGDYWFIIYRSVDGKDLMMYKNLSSDQHSFTDNNLTKGTYLYSIKAVYKDGGESQPMKSRLVNFVPSEK